MFAILTLTAVLVGQAAPRATPAPPPFKAGDRVLIIGPIIPVPRTAPRPQRVLRIPSGLSPSEYSRAMRELTLNSPEEPAPPPPMVAVTRDGRSDRVLSPTRAKVIDGKMVKRGDAPTLEVEIAEGPLKGARVWTNSAPDCLKRDVPGNSRSARRLRAKILSR